MTPTKRFYFTAHPGDLSRRRLPRGVRVMLVAAAHWDEKRKRFRIRRPPADHVSTIAIDSGGFTAAKRWGRYPWTPAQYADFVADTCRDVGLDRLDFVACMDYACEPSVNRSALDTNRRRIDATHDLETQCFQVAPCLPWLPVFQGDTLDERRYDLSRRRSLGLMPGTEHRPARAGVGSICGRGAGRAAEVLLYYHQHVPHLALHAFGLDARTLDHEAAWHCVASWDSYAWTWPSGQKGVDRPGHLERVPGEPYSTYLARCGQHYLRHTIRPRQAPPAQQMLFI